MIDQLSDIERTPQKRLRVEQQALRDRNSAYSSLVTELRALQTRAAALREAGAFTRRAATVDDATVARATVADAGVKGNYTFQFQQLAAAAKQLGAAGTGRRLNETNDVSGLVLSSAGFSTAVTAGTFTVNGRQVTLATSDTLQAVFDKISTATEGAVTGSYDAATDRIRLASAGTIVLGSATDSSNFLQLARLNNNGTGTVTSASDLGSIRLSAALSAANFTTAITGDGTGAGQFKVNGVAIAYHTTDSVSDVLKRINDSGAGVLATYDSVADRFTLTNKNTGDVGMALEDVTGNFLAATGLGGGALQRGRDLVYTLNGGGPLTSRSNTITEESSGLTGLSVTALKEGGTATVGVNSDTEKIKTALQDFVAQYNKVQSLLETQTAVSTSSAGKVTAGILANESDANAVASQLRGLVFSPVSSLQGTIDRLASLGYDTNSEDNSLSLKDPEALDAALQDHLERVAELFSEATDGVATTLDGYLEKLVGDSGTLVAKQDTLTRQAGEIDTQVTDLERLVQANRARLTESFIAMERAQAEINQQLQFLSKQFK